GGHRAPGQRQARGALYRLPWRRRRRPRASRQPAAGWPRHRLPGEAVGRFRQRHTRQRGDAAERQRPQHGRTPCPGPVLQQAAAATRPRHASYPDATGRQPRRKAGHTRGLGSGRPRLRAMPRPRRRWRGRALPTAGRPAGGLSRRPVAGLAARHAAQRSLATDATPVHRTERTGHPGGVGMVCRAAAAGKGDAMKRALAMAGILLGLAVLAACTPEPPASAPVTGATPPKTATTAPAPARFTPPAEAAIPAGPLGEVIRAGRAIFTDTPGHAKAYVGNGLSCSNCHLDAGRRADSAPLWGAWGMYPQYRKKNGHVNSFGERLQGCFEYSMNGKAPPLGSPEIVALEAYAWWIAQGAPVGKKLPGAGYPKGAK